MEQSRRLSANKRIFRWSGDCIARHQGVEMICKSGKAENDLDLRDARWRLSAEKDHPSNIDSSMPVKAFQRYASLLQIQRRNWDKGPT